MWKASGWKEKWNKRSKSTLGVLEEKHTIEVNYVRIDELRRPWVLFQRVNPSKCTLWDQELKKIQGKRSSK